MAARAGISFSGRHFSKAMILQAVRWYLAYALSYRDIEEMMKERGFDVDHSTIQRWVVHYAPQLEKAFHQKKRRPSGSWRLDETYIKVKGEWVYYYRAVDKYGETVDFLLMKKRDTKAAKRYLSKAISRNGKPGKITIDKSGANQAAIKAYNADEGSRIKIRQCKYLNNIVEQDHRFIKRITRGMLGFKNFLSAQRVLAGIELVRMLKKGQMKWQALRGPTAAELFYALAG